MITSVKKFARYILKRILLILAKYSIKKHEINFVLIVGWFGTELVREGTYRLLSEHHNVRRNTKNMWWDLSIPLQILGFEDKRYSLFEWIKIIFKSCVILLLNKQNKHTIVFNINIGDEDSSKYWSNIIDPNFVVFTNYEESRTSYLKNLINSIPKKHVLVSSKLASADLEKFKTYSYDFDSSRIYTPKNEYSFEKNTPEVFLDIYAPILGIAESFFDSKEEVSSYFLKADIRDLLIKRISRKVNEN